MNNEEKIIFVNNVVADETFEMKVNMSMKVSDLKKK